jgi:NAD(P)-dependent dehydrogenase (short-subunit alcohol dehydrogenase family)
MDLVAIVTASTEGIGLAIAKKLASDGAKVMISSRKVRKVMYLLSHPNPFLFARIRILDTSINRCW